MHQQGNMEYHIIVILRRNLIMTKTYDIVVIGGGTAGCAAAYISGLLGFKTLLIERSSMLGGAITSNLVVPVMNVGSNQINNAFYKSFALKMAEMGGQVTYQGNIGWFNPELAKIALDEMLSSVNVDIRFNTEVTNVKTKDNTITYLNINSTTLSAYNYSIYTDNNTISFDNTLSVCIGAKYVVDATGNADFSKKINCEFLDDNQDYQPMSLRFLMSGVDIEKFGKWLIKTDKDRNVTTFEHINGVPHLSTAYTWDDNKNWALAPVFDKAVQNGVLKDTDRNYFQVFTVAGMPSTVAFNCPRIIENLNPNITQDISKALIEGRASIYRLSKFCKEYLPGFEKAFISNISDGMGVRVSNRVKGKYIYTIEDLRSGKKFENPALISNYPVDVHSKDKNSSTLEIDGEYQLPIESLMSVDYDNLFVVGRCLSADYLAQGALRVQANCFAMGEAVARYLYRLQHSNKN